MKSISAIFLLLLLFFPDKAFSQNLAPGDKKLRVDSILSARGEAYLGIPASFRKSFLSGMESLTPAKQTDSLIYFYVDSDQYKLILEKGLEYQVFTAPSMIGPVKMASGFDDILSGKAYPAYQQYLDLMQKFGNDYPGICTIDTIGYSINGRLILAARLQKGEYKEGDRPLVFYSSTMHGDEVVGYSLMLMLINDFLKNSENSDQISAILNDMVLIINPLSNPDGTYFQSDTSISGAKRRNLNNFDLNRNFHDIRSGISYTYTDLQKENLAMVHYMEKFPPALSANFHTGAEVLNYPWDSWEVHDTLTSINVDKFPHTDNGWFIEICKDYVDSARSTDPFYLQTYPEGYVIGSIWYPIYGGRQDFVTYCLRGREMTFELSNITLPDASQLPGFWTKNHAALLNLIEKAGHGVFGIVTDSLTMKPIAAKVEIPGYDKNESFIYSHPATGKFFRYLPEGIYSVQVTANGYRAKTVFAQVIKNQRTELEVELIPYYIDIPEDLEILVKTVPGGKELIIQLKGDKSEVFTADLYDLSGRKIQEKIFIGNTGTIGGLVSQGIYILKVKSDYQVECRLVFFNPH
jgi:hypothetical protein